MKLKILVSFVCSFFLILSCNDKIINPSEKHPPGYQIDIEWPSLRASPWPMYRSNPQNIGRSNSFGALTGNIYGVIDSLRIKSGVVMDIDSTVYFCVVDKNISGLFALNFDGSVKWIYNIDFGGYDLNPSTPVITSGDMIITAFPNISKVFSIKNNGNLNWELNLRSDQSALMLGKDGTLYLLAFDNTNKKGLYAVNQAGHIIWHLDNENFCGGEFNGLAMSPNGKIIYVPGYPFSGTSSALYAINIETKDIIWTFGEKILSFNSFSAPLIDSDGNIYFVSNEGDNGYLYSLSQEGNIRWKYYLGPFQSKYINLHHFSMDKFGNLYFGIDTLYSLDYDGKLRWGKGLSDKQVCADISIDVDNCIYIYAANSSSSEIIKINTVGTTIWQNPIYLLDDSVYSLVVGFNQVIIHGFLNTKYYIQR